MLKLKFIWIFILAIVSSLFYGCDNDSYNEPDEPEDSESSLFPKKPIDFPIGSGLSAIYSNDALFVIINGEIHDFQNDSELAERLKLESTQQPQNVVYITTTTPGQLGKLASKQARTMDKLVVSGPINEKDIHFIRDCAAYLCLRSVDLYAAQIEKNKIPDMAFFKKVITKYTILPVYLPIYHTVLPENLEEIGSSAFANVLLTEIKLPASLKTLASTAFSNTPFLTGNIIYPEGFVSESADQ